MGSPECPLIQLEPDLATSVVDDLVDEGAPKVLVGHRRAT